MGFLEEFGIFVLVVRSDKYGFCFVSEIFRGFVWDGMWRFKLGYFYNLGIESGMVVLFFFFLGSG